jgi:hypothetical protein
MSTYQLHHTQKIRNDAYSQFMLRRETRTQLFLTKQMIDSLNNQASLFPDTMKYAFHLYTVGSNIFNDLLRLTKSSFKLSKMLSEIELGFQIIKPLPYDLIVYRGVKLNSNQDLKDEINLLTSTTYDIAVASSFITSGKCCIYQIKIEKGSRVLCLDNLSAFKDSEHEILLPPGGRFERDPNGGPYNLIYRNSNLKNNTFKFVIPKINSSLHLLFSNQIEFLIEKCKRHIDSYINETLLEIENYYFLLQEFVQCIIRYQKTSDEISDDEFIIEHTLEIVIKRILDDTFSFKIMGQPVSILQTAKSQSNNAINRMKIDFNRIMKEIYLSKYPQFQQSFDDYQLELIKRKQRHLTNRRRSEF